LALKTTDTRNRANTGPVSTPALAAFLAWLVPGAGHMYLGHRARGATLLVVISVTFWGGVAIGGVKSTTRPPDPAMSGGRKAWFVAQCCVGAHAFAAMTLSHQIEDRPPYEYSPYVAYSPVDDIAIVYTGIAGMLNLLAIFDVLHRSRAATEPVTVTESPPARRRS
jgi:hypothetical protein